MKCLAGRERVLFISAVSEVNEPLVLVNRLSYLWKRSKPTTDKTIKTHLYERVPRSYLQQDDLRLKQNIII